MHRIFWSCLLMVLFSLSLKAQVSYKGMIDKYPVEFVMDYYSDGPVQAVYVYEKYDTPILLKGYLQNGQMVLNEKDLAGKVIAALMFSTFDRQQQNVTGTWKSLNMNRELKINLVRQFDLENVEAGTSVELLQAESLKEKYFKLRVSDGRVTGINIYQKKTDSLTQALSVDCQLMGMDNISTGDFNFDGHEDFSVFESSYAGANTSSLYFLFDPATKTYVDSGFEGVSLEFDQAKKLITSVNSCCGGSLVSVTTYRVENNKMVEVEQKCFTRNEDSDELIETTPDKCN